MAARRPQLPWLDGKPTGDRDATTISARGRGCAVPRGSALLAFSVAAGVPRDVCRGLDYAAWGLVAPFYDDRERNGAGNGRADTATGARTLPRRHARRAASRANECATADRDTREHRRARVDSDTVRSDSDPRVAVSRQIFSSSDRSERSPGYREKRNGFILAIIYSNLRFEPELAQSLLR
jgi:hypothetical protein